MRYPPGHARSRRAAVLGGPNAMGRARQQKDSVGDNFARRSRFCRECDRGISRNTKNLGPLPAESG
jgi:hypothetical protein